MPYTNSSGKQCVVYDCKNNQKKLYQWKIGECTEHKLIHSDCPCLQPFKMHTIPRNEELRMSWIKSINRRDFKPHAKAVVCSRHFIDGKPSKENPVPKLSMGYTAANTTPARRRPLVRKSLNLNTPIPSTKCQLTPKPHDKTMSDLDQSEMLIATPFIEPIVPTFSETIPNQCEAVCCRLYPSYCPKKNN